MVMETNMCTAFSFSNRDKTVWDHMLHNTSDLSNGLHELGEPAQNVQLFQGSFLYMFFYNTEGICTVVSSL